MARAVMTVGRLMKALAKYDEDLPVEVSSDPEGNHFSAMHEATEEESERTGERCLTIWPA